MMKPRSASFQTSFAVCAGTEKGAASSRSSILQSRSAEKRAAGITINGGIDRDELEGLWGLGYANSRRLQFTESGLAGLANYIVKSPIGSKAWQSSKNLIDPEPTTRDGRISARRARELMQDGDRKAFERLYPGYCLADAGAFFNDVNGGYYINARYYRADGVYIKPKRKRRKRN